MVDKTKKRGASLLYNGARGGAGLLLKHMLSVTNNGCKTKGDKKDADDNGPEGACVPAYCDCYCQSGWVLHNAPDADYTAL